MDKYLTSEFLWCLAISFFLILASLSFVANQAYHTVSQEEARQVQDALETRMYDATASSIFVNNLAVSWFLVVPLIGAIPFGIVWCNTAWHIGVLAVAYQTFPQTLVANVLVLAFAEILAYTVLLAENLYLSWMLLIKRSLKDATERLTSHYWKSFLFYVFLLFLGAVLEAQMIQG